MIRICLAGASGNVGQRLAQAILASDDLALVAGVSRTYAGQSLAPLLGDTTATIPVYATIEEALTIDCDVVVDYTKPNIVQHHIEAAVAANRHVVIGTSGLSDAQYAKIASQAEEQKVGVFAAGNFSLTAALLQHFAMLAARYVPHWEIIDYAPGSKPDAPSGTARELAYLLSEVQEPTYSVPVDQVQGEKASRGATLNGSQVHSLRVPGFYSSVEAIFGLAGERLSLRHDSMSYQPYVEGTLLAIRNVASFTGLKRGMQNLLKF